MRSRLPWRNRPSLCLRVTLLTWFIFCRSAQEHTHAELRFLIKTLRPSRSSRAWYKRHEIRALPRTLSRLLWRSPRKGSMYKLRILRCKSQMAWVFKTSKFRSWLFKRCSKRRWLACRLKAKFCIKRQLWLLTNALWLKTPTSPDL